MNADAAAQGESTLMGRWQLQSLQRPSTAVPSIPRDPEAYVLELRPTAAAVIRADCNRGAGEYASSGRRLSITVTRMTRARCPTDSLFEAFVTLLEGVHSFRLDGDVLSLTASPAATATFRRIGQSPAVQTPLLPR
jgi:heat shock protein HslJ